MEKGVSRGLYTMLGEGSVFEGSLTVPHDVRIDGTLKGNLNADGALMVGSNGIIEADIVARSAVVGGRITGKLTVSDRVEMESSSSLIGDLMTRELVINEGAIFQGHCSMAESKKTKV